MDAKEDKQEVLESERAYEKSDIYLYRERGMGFP